MASATQARRLASPALRALMRQRLAELSAIALGVAGLVLLVALASYNPHDPSLNTATSRPVTNLAGPLGAVVSDALLQVFGAAGALPGLALLAWAWRVGSHRGLGSPALRLVCLVLAVPALAAVLGAWPVPMPRVLQGWPASAGPGGAAGWLLGGGLLGMGRDVLGPTGALLVWGTCALLAGTLVVLALGLTATEWRVARRGAAGAARLSLRRGRRLAPVFARAFAPVRAGAAALLRPLARLNPLALLQPASGTGRSRAKAATRQTILRLEPPRPTPDAPPPAPPRPASPAPDVPKPPTGAAVGAGADDARETGPLTAPSKSVKIAMPPAPKPTAAAPWPDKPTPSAEGGWRFPPLSLLTPAPTRTATGPSAEALQANARLLETVLNDYGVQGAIREIRPGPVVTLYELEPAPGIRSARVIGLADDVARSLSVTAVRIATVPGRNAIGIEVPNAKRETVYLSELLGSDDWTRHPGRLALALGKDIGGTPVVADLSRMPHLLIAGTTGSGKSVGINAMILSLLFRLSPDQCRLIMIDPKMLELSVYEGIPHLMAPVVTDPAKAVTALKWTVREMERRYRAMSQLGVRNVGGYNERVTEARAKGEVVTRRVQTGFDPETGKPIFEETPLALEPLPFIVVVIDEMADLMMVAGKDIEAAVQRLAQMARAAGIHVVMATQRPSVDVITGTIKANFPTRISFQVISKFDSRTILGEQGAEQLLGQGDLLHMQGGGRIARVHGPFVEDREVEEIVAFLRAQGEPAYVEEVTEGAEDDDGANPALSGIAAAGDGEKGLFDQAVALVSREGKASTSFIQRHLNIGYNRAAKLIEQMEKEGIVSAANHVGKREVLTRRTGADED